MATVNVQLERRLLEVERQTDLLIDRTKHLADQTDGFRRTLRKESQKREEAVQDLAEVRNSMQQSLGLELEAFRSAAEDKLQGLVDTESTIKNLEKRVQRDAEKEMRQALSYATHRTEEDEKWRFRVHEDLKEELHQMSSLFSEKIEDSTTKVEEQVVALRRRMHSYTDDQYKMNKQTTADGLAIQQSVREEAAQREGEIKKLEQTLQDLRHEQKSFEVSMDERIRAWEQQGADLHASTLQRVAEIRVELMGMLSTVEEKFKGEINYVTEQHMDLQNEFSVAINSVRNDLEAEKDELQNLYNIVEHNKSDVQQEMNSLQQKLEKEVVNIHTAQRESLLNLRSQQDEKFKGFEMEIDEQKSSQKLHFGHVGEKLKDIKSEVNNNENDIKQARHDALREQALLQKAVENVRATMQAENNKKQETMNNLREQINSSASIMSDQFERFDKNQSSMQSRVNEYENRLTNEEEVRAQEIHRLERHFENTACKEAIFLDFKRNQQAQEKKNEAQMGETLRSYVQLKEEMELALNRVDSIKRQSLQTAEEWSEHKAECDLKERVLQTLKADFISLENKLAQSPLLERILRPVSGMSPLSRASTPNKKMDNSSLRKSVGTTASTPTKTPRSITTARAGRPNAYGF